MKALFLIIFFTICASASKAQDLTIPIEGTYGIDYIIVNYPDWHFDDGPVLVEDGFLRDHKCGTKTYDGHQGTDFVIRGFTQMDSSVNVMAVEAGEIIHVTEDLFDRETEGIVEYGLGNYVGIYHASSNTYSYYAHLRTSSVIVEVGDLVSAGEIIAEVGSSGNSTDPHLHFELWNPGVLTDPTIDPWGIPCDSGSTRWESPPIYDTSYALWECGFVNYDSVENFIPSTWVPLKERLGLKSDFNSDDPFFTYWALQYGLKLGDETTIEWYEPNGDLYATETTTYLTQDWWFHYYNHSIETPPLSKQGIWNIRYYYNDSLQLSKSFSYGHLSNNDTQLEDQNPTFSKLDDNTLLITFPDENLYNELCLYNVAGVMLIQERLNESTTFKLRLPEKVGTGIYIIALSNDETRYVQKVFFE
ncbi:MAG: peptidoglycan DD-metalloendopeptidase family protein [Crocinitomix sp.]|nr:peptidoglycan DD-metalloendopeptidase family protein [Crocinitomix sp.]